MSRPKKNILSSRTTQKVVAGNAAAVAAIMSILWLLRQVSPLPWGPEQDGEVAALLSIILGPILGRAAAGVGK